MTNSTNSKNLSPLVKVRTIRSLLLTTLYICNGIETGRIPAQLFNEDLQLRADGKIFGIARPLVRTDDLTGEVNNLKVGMLGVCCIGLDTLLDEAFGKKPENYDDSDIDALRAIVYMIRCAFAHEPTLPVWKITSRKYLREFRINELDIEVDLINLNRQVLIGSQYGGWEGIFKIMDYCEKVVGAL